MGFDCLNWPHLLRTSLVTVPFILILAVDYVNLNENPRDVRQSTNKKIEMLFFLISRKLFFSDNRLYNLFITQKLLEIQCNYFLHFYFVSTCKLLRITIQFWGSSLQGHLLRPIARPLGLKRHLRRDEKFKEGKGI